MATKSSRLRFLVDSWNTLAEPSKPIVTVGGRIVAATSRMRSTAAPSDTPDRNPNDTDTDGSCPEWLMLCGPTVSIVDTTVWSGTSAPRLVLNVSLFSESAYCWYFGSSSMSTRYCVDSP